MQWHNFTSIEVLENLETTPQGLTHADRQERLNINGENILETKNALPLWKKIGKHFVDILMLVLIAAGILKGLTGSPIEMWIIFAVVIVNGLMGYYQERKAEASLNGLKQMMGQEAVILVDNQREKVESSTLVVGDIVVLNRGDMVPADLRLIESHDLLIEEAILTGESLPIEKNTQVLEGEITLGDQINMAFSGTLVLSGSGLGVVTKTANDTEIGKINAALQSVKPQTTPLIRKMNQFNKQIFKALIFFIVFLIFFTTLRFGLDMEVLLAAVISLIVAVIPEGLPAVLTMILSMGVKEMADENAIIKSMPAVETLGSITVICSDKTGTLTKNQMQVTEIELGLQAQENTQQAETDLNYLHLVMENCQDIKRHADQKIADLSGNPTEMALLTYTDCLNIDHLSQEAKIPFSSDYKYMATSHPHGQNQTMIFVKGAPDVLMAKANLTPEEVAHWQDKAMKLASKGQRVLGFAMKLVESSHQLSHESLEGIQILALVGIIDPPKASAIEAVAECQQAGITVKMITGDHKETARAIGREIGLKHTAVVLEGNDIDKMTDKILEEQVGRVDIFARTTPDHKLRIVTALQKQGEIVAMTGDDVNDAPALKKADIGVAMGIKGSEVTKQAADMVLADDNFATIAKAVKEGRRIYDNLKKTINFFLPTSLSQGLIVIFALMTNQPLPLTLVQILWVNMVTTRTLSYALGFEKAHPQIMHRSPRKTDEGILSKYNIFRVLYVSLLITIPSYMLAMSFDGYAVQQTVLLQSIVFAQAVYMINCREVIDPALNKSFLQNKALFISLGILLILQVLIMLPLAQYLVGTTVITGGQFVNILLNSLMIFIVVEIEKVVTSYLIRRKERSVVRG